MTSASEGFEELRGRLARSPHDRELFYAVCAAAGDAREAELRALIEHRLNSIPAGQPIRLHDLHMRSLLREKQGRASAGLSVTNTNALDDLQIKFARDDLAMIVQEAAAILQRDGREFAAAVLLAESLVGLGAIDEAEAIYAQIRQSRNEHITSVTSFDPAFHAGLPDIAHQAAARLPPILVSREIPAGAEVVFTAADYAYFQKFGWDFVTSFARHGHPDVCLALHIYDMTPEEKFSLTAALDAVPNLRWGLTSEWTGLKGGEVSRARGYYHAVRFIRLWQFLEHHRAPAWMIDMDTVFNGDVKRLFAALSGFDLALFLTPGRFEVRNKVMASCTGIANTGAAREYIRNVGGYVGAYQKEDRLLWGIDQIAMFAILMMYGPRPSLRITGVPEGIADGHRRPDGLLWPAKGHT